MNYIETENTRKVVQQLRRHTDKPIQVKDLAEFAGHPDTAYAVNYLGSAKEYSNEIEVHLNLTKSEDVREAVFVHEVLHIVLHHEGFPGIATRADMVRFLQPNDALVLKRLQEILSSTIDHLQVYKRMIDDFTLNSATYFEEQVQGKIRRFGRFPYKAHTKDTEYYFNVQQDILDGLNYYQFPDPCGQRILAVFKDTCPAGFSSCSALYGKISKISYSTPQLAYRCATLIRDQIIKYGHKKAVGMMNQYWSALSVVRDAREIPLEKG